MCMALMFALYPTCKAIIIHASWQSQAPSLLHLQLLALGDDMTVRLISPLLHITPCVSLSVFLHSVYTAFEFCSDPTTWKIFYLSNPCDTSVAFMRLAVYVSLHWLRAAVGQNQMRTDVRGVQVCCVCSVSHRWSNIKNLNKDSVNTTFNISKI